MMKIVLYGSIILLLFLTGATSRSQEVLGGLQVNNAVREQHLKHPVLKSSAGMVELPFFDDFSGSEVYPDHTKWADRYVYINTNYPVNPVSAGVATLDAIDETGALYEHATIWPFLADRLTSNPINLSYMPADSIYLSFFYQPQGRGDVPQPHDSLRVEFWSPSTESWSIVWSVPGDSLHEFRLVMIPVTDTIYLMEGFRFRFSNIASIADNRTNPGSMGNADHWHIDYVVLDRNRSFTDTVFRDVAFTEPIRSALNNYEAMPWEQFRAGRIVEMGSVLPVSYRNIDIITRSVQRHFSIYDVYENRLAHSFSGGSTVIGPGEIHNFDADLTWSFTSASTDSARFRIRAWLTVDGLEPDNNDTVIYYQDFGNYFALDDGSAENGYGLSGGGAENARIACRFRAYRADTLRAVKIYFNQSLNDASRHNFKIAVWNDDSGRPGNLVYSQEGFRPEYEDGVNSFHTYRLDEAIPVSQVFYVGIIQTSSNFLNIGFDVNRNNRSRNYYNIHGEWKNSSFEGSLMIRPVLGMPQRPANVADPVINEIMRVYPNPASDVIFFDLEPGIDRRAATISLINTLGQTVYRMPGTENSMDVSMFPAGIYFIRAETGNDHIETRKILIK